MKTLNKGAFRSVVLAGIAALSLAALPAANAQQPATMAPPVAAASGSTYDAGAPASQSVYNWHDVPVNQKVTIVRAVFDQGGYQLYDDKGETIVVPFVNQNLYVMRFGQTDGATYFINDGNTPTLYLPKGGYLTNSAAQGSRWYPFGKSFNYTAPVYEGPAPSWDAYVNMAWYPGMIYYGGYWGYHTWAFGLSFSPMPGLYFNIGGAPFFGWGAYHNYYFAHPYNRVLVHNAVVFNHYNVGVHGPGAFGQYHGGVAYHSAGFSHSGGFGSYGRATSVGRPAFGTAHSSIMPAQRSFGSTGSFGGGRSFSAPSGGNRSFGGGGGSFGGNRSFGGGGAAHFGGGNHR